MIPTDSRRRWEVGSSFPFALPNGPGWPGAPEPLRFFGSGRQALRALLEFGRHTFGWTAAHLPTYYCPPLVDSIADVLPIRRYGCGPLGAERPPVAGPTEVVVAVSYFGAPPVVPAATGAALIIDATHDPLAGWLDRTGADYVFASLRKTLPLPDGGALWSGTGRLLPPDQPPTPDHLAAVGGILSAMCLKAAYLDGADLPKEAYQTLFSTGEEQFAGTGVSGISAFSRTALRVLPAVEFRRLRIHNAAALATALAGLAGIVVRSYSFGVVLECDSHRRRETIRQELIANDVYPAVLWPLPAAGDPTGLPGRESAAPGDFSRRMLFLHTDFRWQEADMHRVADLIHALAGRPAQLLAQPVGASC